jgi:O-antigen/teichoic acid export membrane protein
MALNTATTALTLILLAMGEGLLAVVVSGLVLNIIAIPVMYMMARRVLPSLRVLPRFSWAVFRELMTFGTAFLLSSMGVVLLYQADKLLLGSILGVAAVTYYVVPGGLAQRIQGLVAAATSIVFPVSSALFESGDHDALRRLYSEGTRLVYILVVMTAVPMAVFADKFLLYWMGAEIARNSALAMVLLVGTYSILGASAIPWGIANGSGRAGINAFFTLAIAAADIGLFLLWIRPYGVAGAAAAYLVSAAIGVPLLTGFLERRVLGLSGFRGAQIFLPVAAVGLLQAVVALPLRFGAVNLWATMGLMILSALTFPMGYWVFGLVQDGDRRLVSLLLQRFKGTSPGSSPEA